ncbi:regulator of G-protein signaling 12-like [Antedon mediterranea]|uniref:regulator of G-protein signaling 12-like n=1 Tax=Antedon mediterranea TaxID=105859 RepID=UPI003AF53BC0
MNSSRKKGKIPLMKKTVEVGRAPNGYGFTIAGQAPCVLSCILSGSPSEQADLKPGDRILAINGKNVSRMSHEQVVKLIGNAVDVLRLTVAEQEPCESSDEEFNTRPPRYSNIRPKSTPPGNRTDSAIDSFMSSNYTEYYGASTPSNVISPEEARLAPGHLSPFNKSGRAEILLRKSIPHQDAQNLNGKSSGRNNVPPKVRRARKNTENRTRTNSHVENNDNGESYTPLAQRSRTPVQLSNILYPSLQPQQTPMHGATPPTGHASMRVVVGYLGSIDIPASANLPTASLQAIRGCVRRLRVEQRIHSAVLMEISESGVRLVNKARRTMVVYPADCVAFSGVCPDDKRFFGIVTAQTVYDAFDGNTDDEDDEPVGSSCHVFVANPEISPHTVHAKLALEFGINCTLDPHYNGCIEFPHSSKSILRAITMLYSEQNNTLYQSANSPFYRGHHSNSNSSTSDSGIGYTKDSTDQKANNNSVPILDVASHIRAKRNAEVNGQSNVHLVRAEINSSSDFPYSVSSASPASVETSPQTNLTDRLTPRARPNPVGFRNNTGVQGQQNGVGGRPLSAGSVQQLHRIIQQRNQPHLGQENEHEGDVDDESDDDDVHPVNRHLEGRPPLPHGRNSMYSKLENNGTRTRRGSDGYPLSRQDPLRYSDGSETWSVRRSSRPRLIRNNQPGCRESLAASDSEVPNGESRIRCNSLSSAASSLSIHGRAKEGARRVSGWAVGFDRLLADELGVSCFTEFLKKEFSEENILFWIACEHFSKLTNKSKIKKKAQEIYNTFLTDSAIHPVNLDGTVKQMVENNLSSPTSNTYQYPQQQIFHLMKYDSYARFLKSDLYKQCIVAELEGRPLPIQVPDNNGNEQVTGKRDNVHNSVSSNVSLSDESTIQSQTDNKKWTKRSILPWNRKRKTSSSKDNNSVSSGEARNSGDFGQVFCSDKKLDVLKPIMKHRSPSKHYICVTIPDDSCTRVLIRRGYSMRSAIASICEQRHIPMAAMEVFFADSKEVVDLEQDMAAVGPRHVIIEKRVLFKIELPNKRVIGVKSKPTKKLYEVLKPITHKYQLILDAMVVHLMGSPVPLDMDIIVESLDNRRILIETVEQYSAGTYKMNRAETAMPPKNKTKLHKSISAESVLTHGPARHVHTHKQNGSVQKTSDKIQKSNEKQAKDINSTFGRRLKSPLKKVSNKSKDNMNRKDADDLIAAVSKAQGSRLNDQRGLTILNLELPDFLKKSPNSAGVNPPEDRPRTAMGITNAYQLPEFLQNDEEDENGALFSKTLVSRSKSTPPIAPTHYQTPSNLPDGIIPTHYQAEEIFGQRNMNMTAPKFSDSIVENSFRETNWTLNPRVHKLPGRRGLGYANSQSEQALHQRKCDLRSYSQNSLQSDDLNANNGSNLKRINSLHYQEEAESTDSEEEEEDDNYGNLNSTTNSVPPPPSDANESTLNLDMPDYSPPTPITYHGPPSYRKVRSESTPPQYVGRGIPIPQRLEDETEEDLGTLPPSPSTHDLILSIEQEEMNLVKDSVPKTSDKPSPSNIAVNQKNVSKPDVTLSAINVLEKQDKRSRLGISFPAGTVLQTPNKQETPSSTNLNPADKRFVINKDGRRLRATFV